MTPSKFDLMALADVGGQPRKLAIEIHRQIRARAGKLTLPMPLQDIAMSLGITEIVVRQTTTFDGMLVTIDDKSSGAIVLRRGMTPGRTNFTLGHEIGHFVNPFHKPPDGGFVCDATGLRAKRAGGTPFKDRPLRDRMEIEANEFSQALLVPVPEYNRERGTLKGCDLRHIESLARTFGMSKEAMARIYVDTAPETIGVLATRAGKLEKFILPSRFPFLGLAKGRDVPPGSMTTKVLKNGHPGECTELSSVSPDVWLERSSVGTELYEQVLVQQSNWAMTMLLVDEPERSEDSEDEEVRRRWATPRFAYGR